MVKSQREGGMAESDQGSNETNPGISDAEHAVMEALWRRSPLTATEVCDSVSGERDWSLATVKTLLSRLVTKNAVGTKPDGRRFLYSPLLERSDYVGTESKRLVDRLFGGRVAPLVSHLVEAEALSEDDLAEIEALLNEMRK
jgi:predicted transcriptional regulator